jgi:hypothetical protein
MIRIPHRVRIHRSGRCDVASANQDRRTEPRRHMIRFFASRRSTRLFAGAVFPFMVWVLLTPTVARAGCSHLVTSRTTSPRILSLTNLSGDGVGQSEPLPVPSSPRPCSGAWCPEQPATPAVPPGSIGGRLAFWAWCAETLKPILSDPVFLTLERGNPRAVHRRTVVFHPPPLIPPA